MDGAFPFYKDQEGPGQFGHAGAGRGPGRSGFRGTADNAKTRICTRWQAGDCRFGDRCNFAHGEHELRASQDRAQDGGYNANQGRGYGGGRGAHDGGRGYGGGRAHGGHPAMGYHTGYDGMGQPLQAMQIGYGVSGSMGYDQPGGMPEEAWAAQGYPVGGPNGWCMYRTKDTGEVYYHNHRTNMTTWEQPADWQPGAV